MKRIVPALVLLIVYLYTVNGGQSGRNNLDAHEVREAPSSVDHGTIKQRLKRSIVGVPCFESTDCQSNGMYCDGNRKCVCLSTYIEIGGSCWQKINPDEAGCINNRQCSSVWPGAYCKSGVCKCANDQPAFVTRDGPICLDYGSCPTNGDNPMFIEVVGAGPKPCGFGDDNACPKNYDCYCSKQFCGLNGNSGISGNIFDIDITYCCPSRAFACIQDRDEGQFRTVGLGSIERRWYYNSITENCEEFLYRGRGGNANNFKTSEQCESYCRGACRRGRPEYTIDPVVPVFGPPRLTMRTCSDCSAGSYECTSMGTQSFCCPTIGSICSEPISTDAPQIAAVIPRWRYNSGLKKCEHFFYNAMGGNFNNFLSQDQCELFCAESTCPAGTPLSVGGSPKQCESNQNCPSTHECSESTTPKICCPRKQSVCSLPKAIGSCFNYVERWWYNAAAGTCERFTFSGCQGNANNFRSSDACTSFCTDTAVEPKCIQGKALKDATTGVFVLCGASADGSNCPPNYDCYFDGVVNGCCPTQSYTCSLTFNEGTSCGPSVTRWWYNPITRSCQTFTYLGCDGSSNNFATQVDCQDYCAVGGCPEGGEPYRESGGAYRVCAGGGSCPYTHYCTRVAVTPTNIGFHCCPTRAYVCSLPLAAGQRCTATTMTRYRFNVESKKCETFEYNGCGGNRNNFPSTALCLSYCNSAGCPAGTVALYEKDGSGVLTKCAVGTLSCPQGYACTYSTLLQQGICCGAPLSEDKCRQDESPYIDSLTNRPRQCIPNQDDSCPVNYLCWYSSTNNAYYCCGGSATTCPQGGSPWINPVTSVAQQCTPGIIGSCRHSYTCQATFITVNGIPSTTGYCCGSLGFCGSGQLAQMENNLPVTCESSGTVSTCGAGYICQFSKELQQSYCCTPKSDVVAAVCGSSAIPYILNQAPVVCNMASVETNCPHPFVCQLYAPSNNFYCCKTGEVLSVQVPVLSVHTGTSNGCPPGLSALLKNNQQGQFEFCTPIPNSCSTVGYHCLYDASRTRYKCCGTPVPSPPPPTPKPRCPDGQISKFTCHKQGNCGPGFDCIKINAGYYCCEITVTISAPTLAFSDSCPNGFETLLNPYTNQAQSCAPEFGGCPSSHSCTKNAVGSYYCCKLKMRGRSGVANCAAGHQVYIVPGTNQVQACDSRLLSGCPPGYVCMSQETGGLVGYCCGNPGSLTTPNDGCPQGRSHLYPGSLTPLECSLGGFPCPPGFRCLPSMRFSGKFQCCSSSAVPVRHVAAQTKLGLDKPIVLKPGSFGCTRDNDCRRSGEPSARCKNGRCLCSAVLLAYNGRCVNSCPWPYRNFGGVCTASATWRNRAQNFWQNSRIFSNFYSQSRNLFVMNDAEIDMDRIYNTNNSSTTCAHTATAIYTTVTTTLRPS